MRNVLKFPAENKSYFILRLFLKNVMINIKKFKTLSNNLKLMPLTNLYAVKTLVFSAACIFLEHSVHFEKKLLINFLHHQSQTLLQIYVLHKPIICMNNCKRKNCHHDLHTNNQRSVNKMSDKLNTKTRLQGF